MDGGKTKMKNLKTLQVAAFPLIFLMLLLTVNFSSDAQAQPNIRTVALPTGTPSPWQMEWDGYRYIWFSGSTSNEGFLTRVDTWLVESDSLSATLNWVVAPPLHAETGSAYAGASVGVALGGGYVWSGGQYSGADTIKTELLSRFNPSTFEVKYYWLGIEAKSVRAIRYDGKGNIWIAASRILKFEIAAETATVCTEPLGAYDLLVDGSTLWATAPLPNGIIKFDMNTLDCKKYVPSSHPALLAKDALGNVWFSMNNDQKIGKLNSLTGAIVEYNLKSELGTADAPYGLAFDKTGKLWVAGYGAKKILRFDPVKSSIVERFSVSNNPYYPISDSYDKIWCWGRGSVDLNVVNVGSEVLTSSQSNVISAGVNEPPSPPDGTATYGTALSLSADKTTVLKAESVTFTSTLTYANGSKAWQPVGAGKPIDLYVNGAKVAAGATDADGRYVYTCVFNATGTFNVQSKFEGGTFSPYHMSVSSATITVQVVEQPTLLIFFALTLVIAALTIVMAATLSFIRAKFGKRKLA